MIFGPIKLLLNGLRDLIIVALIVVAAAGILGVTIEGIEITTRHVLATILTIQIMTLDR